MPYCTYGFRVIPDLSLNKYSSLAETGPKGVIEQHHSFWRHINQWGKLFQGSISFIYQFDPTQGFGKRMTCSIRFSADDQMALESAKQVMAASVLEPYYEDLKLTEDTLTDDVYPWMVNLSKKPIFYKTDDGREHYVPCEWEMNDEARLYSMLRLMSKATQPCAYCVRLFPVDDSELIAEDMTFMLQKLREMSSFSVKTNGGSISSSGRDENAKKIIKCYDDLMEDISMSPHFEMNIMGFAQDPYYAKQIVDAAASEALDEGNYVLYTEKYGRTLQEMLEMDECRILNKERVPEEIGYLSYVNTLEQAVPFAMLPVLFPGETIEMPKETVPAKQNGLLLGLDDSGHEVYYPWKNLGKHGFLAGMPGSGKTNTMMYLISEMHKKKIPLLVLEPAKREYRSLTVLEGMKDIHIFSPSAGSRFPIHINPFEFPRGMKLSDHIGRLIDVFMGSFQLDPPMPMLLAEAIQACYEELDWIPSMTNYMPSRTEEDNGFNLKYPTMSMLYHKIEELLATKSYAEEVRSNLEAVLEVRIGSLLAREMGDIFDVPYSTFEPQEWLHTSAIMELASLGSGPCNFMILMLMTTIRETLDLIPYEIDKEDPKPRHVMFLEEAHNLIASTTEQVADSVDPKISATKYITTMLAEVRALGQGIIIADQLPTAMAPEVVKNTSLKIGLRLTAQDERETLGSTMSADSLQKEQMATFEPGFCLAGYEGLLKPFRVKIPEFKGDDVVNNIALYGAAVRKESYLEMICISSEIMQEKYELALKQLGQEETKLITRIETKLRDKEKSKIKQETLSNESIGLYAKYCKLCLELLTHDILLRELQIHTNIISDAKELTMYKPDTLSRIQELLDKEAEMLNRIFHVMVKMKEKVTIKEKIIVKQKVIENEKEIIKEKVVMKDFLKAEIFDDLDKQMDRQTGIVMLCADMDKDKNKKSIHSTYQE